MSFSGFSEDDIRKLTKTQEVNKQHKVNKTPVKKVTFKSNNTINTPRSKNILNNTVSGTNNNLQTQELPENAKLSIPNNGAKNNDSKNSKDSAPSIQKAAKGVDPPKEQKSQEVEPVINQEKKFKDLDEFEAKQKLIEEQNRKRKELLAKALADRTKQTQEEAQRLGEIQEEFKKLDAVLSTDVKILRQQIELASIEYMECQKRYQKIEKEFLEAKVLLHQKLEKKEMLTEHLCTIIEKNEERKAEKLTELLQKLQITDKNNIAIENDAKSTDADT